MGETEIFAKSMKFGYVRVL